MLRDVEEFPRVCGDRTADRERASCCPSRCEPGYASRREAARPGRFDERGRGQLAASGWEAVPALLDDRDRLTPANPVPNRPDAPRDLVGPEGISAASRDLAAGLGCLGNAARGRPGSS